MNIKKFNNWKKWIEKQDNKDGAEFVFNYWLKVKSQINNINTDFSKGVEENLNIIKKSYAENKIEKFEIGLLDRFGLTLSKDLYEKLKKDLSNENLKLTEVFKMIKSAFYYNRVSKKNEKIMYIVKIIEKMNNYSLYRNLNDIESVLKEITKKYKIINNYLVVKIENINIMETFASPSWCTNFKLEYQEKYLNEYDVYYVFEEINNSLFLYGFNYIKGENLLYNVFDQYNNNILNNKVKKIYNDITPYEDKINIVNKINKIENIKVENKVFLMISNFVDEEIIESEIDNHKNYLFLFYELLTMIETHNEYYFINNIIKYLEKSNKLFNVAGLLITSKNINKLDKMIIDRFFSIKKSDKLLYSYLSRQDVINKDNFNKYKSQITETDLCFFYYKFLNNDEKKTFHINFYSYLNNDYKKEAINHIIKEDEKSLIRKIINDKRIKNISLFEQIMKNYNIDKIISLKEKEDLLIKLNFMNKRNLFFINYYKNNNKINKKRIIDEKIKNKTFSLLFVFFTSSNTYCYKDFLKIIKNNNYEIEKDRMFDSKILIFENKNQAFVYYKYIKILKYESCFIDIIENNVNVFNKKEKDIIIKEIIDENFLKFFLKNNKYKIVNPISYLNNKLVEIFKNDIDLDLKNIEKKQETE